VERSNHGKIKVLFQYLPGGSSENHGKTTVRGARVPAKIQSKYFLNTRVEHCQYTSQLGPNILSTNMLFTT
jgi:hypothetical protein